ncbi:TPA: hypothetical protein DD394_03225, partial [bacterium UBP9_UBA11836]|nr:hypothetical protein [bacterium UBP9_UBA11836]
MPLFKRSKSSRDSRDRRSGYGFSKDRRTDSRSYAGSSSSAGRGDRAYGRERTDRSSRGRVINPEYADSAELVAAAQQAR